MIAVHALTLRAGKFVLRDIAFEIPTGAHGVLMGRTGCGKTTLLEAICGLRVPDAGKVIVNSVEVTQSTPAQRGIGYVPQDRALFEHMTVFENIAFALSLRRWPDDKIAARVNELAEWMGVSALLKRHPVGLSGGEAQRIALARALAVEPAALLLDEPLNGLDEEKHAEMCALLGRVKERTRTTILHVTHSRTEAERLADVVFVLADGAVRRKEIQSRARQ